MFYFYSYYILKHEMICGVISIRRTVLTDQLFRESKIKYKKIVIVCEGSSTWKIWASKHRVRERTIFKNFFNSGFLKKCEKDLVCDIFSFRGGFKYMNNFSRIFCVNQNIDLKNFQPVFASESSKNKIIY